MPTPSGRPFTQAMAAELSQCGWLVFACGRYEGIDARVVADARERMPVAEVSVGDYVLSGGEPAVLVMIDAIGRLLPGVLGNAGSAADDSFGGGGGPMAGLLEGPSYTRPRTWRGREVPAGAAVRGPRRDRPVAAGRGAAPDRRGPAGPGDAAARAGPRAVSTSGTGRCSLDAGFPVNAGGCGTLEPATHVGRPCGCASWCPRSPGYPEYTDRRHAFAGLCARADN